MRGIEQIPRAYDLFMWLLETAGFRSWRRQLAGGVCGRTLDLGCGTGRNLRLFPNSVPVVGLELDPRMVDRARRRAPGRTLVLGRAEALPFRSGTFKTVVSSLVFCSVGDPERGLREVKRVLRPEGQLRMLEHVRSDWRPVAWLQDTCQPVWTLVSGGCHPNRATEQLVERAGFRVDPQGRQARGTMRRFSARIR